MTIKKSLLLNILVVSTLSTLPTQASATSWENRNRVIAACKTASTALTKSARNLIHEGCRAIRVKKGQTPLTLTDVVFFNDDSGFDRSLAEISKYVGHVGPNGSNCIAGVKFVKPVCKERQMTDGSGVVITGTVPSTIISLGKYKPGFEPQ